MRRDFVGLGLVLLGGLLRLARWLDARSLHADEAALALGVLERDGLGLLGGLGREQVAPLGYLWLETAAVHLFGEGRLALRAPSLLAGLLALCLFGRLCHAVLPRPEARLALLLFALSEPLVFYSSELKPYALDVAVALAIALLALSRARGAALLLVPLGALAAWLSFAAAFACAAAAAVLLADVRQGRRAAPLAGATLGVWLASGIVHARLALAGAPRAMLASFWDFGFPARPWWKDPDWLVRSVVGAFRDPAGLEFAGLGAGLGLAGVAAAWWRSRRAAAVLGLPVLLALAAALLRLYPFPTSLPASYPFHGRLVLFLAPSLLFFVAIGWGLLRDSLDPPRRWLAGLLAVVLVWPAAATAARGLAEPPRFQDVAPLVDLIGRRARPGDYVFVSEWAGFGFEYHRRERLAGSPGLAALRVRRLGVHGSRAEYERALSEPRPGDRVWTLFSHQAGWHSEADEAAAADALAARGRRLLQRLAPGASAQLYVIGGEAGR